MQAIRKSVDVVVVGAGPAGLVSALLACKKGLKVCVVERDGPEKYHGYAHYLNAQSLDILARCGLDVEKFSQRATDEEDELTMVYASDVQSPFARIRLTDDQDFYKRHKAQGPYGSGINYGYQSWRSMLLEACREAKILILWQAGLLEVDTKRKEAVVEVSGERNVIAYSWLLACDGSNSHVRTLLDVPYAIPKYHWQNFLSVQTEVDLSEVLTEPAMMRWLYHVKASACLVVHDRKRLQVWQIPLHGITPLQDLDEAVVHDTLRDLLGVNEETYLKFGLQISGMGRWSMQTHALSRLNVDGEVFFIGDSGHAMTPAGGLGLNTALADADNLIWKIALEKRSTGSGDLASYDRERGRLGRERVMHSIDHYKDYLKVPQAFGLQEIAAPLGSALHTVSWRLQESAELFKHYCKAQKEQADGPIDDLQWLFSQASGYLGADNCSVATVNLSGVFQHTLKALFSFSSGASLPSAWIQSRLSLALESNKQYFSAIEAHLCYQYAKNELWVCHALATPKSEKEADNKCDAAAGEWIGYAKVQDAVDPHKTMFITQWNQQGSGCVLCTCEAAWEELSGYFQRNARFRARVGLMSRHSYRYSDWKRFPVLLVRPDRIVQVCCKGVSRKNVTNWLAV